MTNKQEQKAAEIYTYNLVLSAYEEGVYSCDSEEEKRVALRAVVIIEDKLGSYTVVPQGTLMEIIDFVKDNY